MLLCILDRLLLNNHSAPMVYTGRNIADGRVAHYHRYNASQRMADKAGATQDSLLLFEASLVLLIIVQFLTSRSDFGPHLGQDNLHRDSNKLKLLFFLLFKLLCMLCILM